MTKNGVADSDCKRKVDMISILVRLREADRLIESREIGYAPRGTESRRTRGNPVCGV